MHQQAAQATWNPERDLWETEVLDLFSEHSDAFSETLPISGMTRSGRLFLRPQSEPPMVGSESSSSLGLPTPRATRGGPATETVDLLPTPRVSSGNGTSEAELAAGNPYSRLETEVELLPTPAAYDGMKGGSQHPAKRRAGGHQPSVADVVEHLLPTPRASDGEKGGPNQRGSKGDLTVSSAVHLLPTPKAGDADFGLPRTSGRPPEMSTHLATRIHYTDFGQYAPAIARWESVMGREAPAPTEITDQSRRKCNVHGEERRSREELHRMREAADEETIRERSARGQGSVHESDSLLPGVREHQGRGRKGHASLASEETPKGELPGVRISERPARPSHGQEPGEQRSGEPDDTVRVMPPETPLAGGSSEKAGSEPVGETCICKHRLSAKFVEFLMGQSDGWVTDEELGLSRVQQLRALGNGVVTQQAVFAINWLLERAQDQRRKAA